MSAEYQRVCAKLPTMAGYCDGHGEHKAQGFVWKKCPKFSLTPKVSSDEAFCPVCRAKLVGVLLGSASSRKRLRQVSTQIWSIDGAQLVKWEYNVRSETFTDSKLALLFLDERTPFAWELPNEFYTRRLAGVPVSPGGGQ